MKKLIIIISLFSLFMVDMFFIKNIFAMTPTYPNDAKFSRGVGNADYYVGSSATGYTSKINSAIDNWVDTGYGWNPIYLYPVASSYATAMDFYLLTESQAIARYGSTRYKTTLADTTYYLTNSAQIDMNSQNWFYTEIRLNSYSLNTVANQAAEFRTGEIKHEIGHALGLYDQNTNPYSIMCGLLTAGRVVQNVDQTSHNAINAMYN